MRRYAWWAYLALGVLAVVPYFVLPLSVAGLNMYYDAVAAAALLALLVGIRLHRPARAGPWHLFAVGLGLWLLGEVLWNWYEVVLHQEPFPSVADVAYLLAYPFLALGFVLLIRERHPGRDRASLIDATIVTTGLALIAWVYLIDPYAGDASLSSAERLISVLYPLGDVLLLAVMVRLLVARGPRPPAYALLAGFLGMVLVADVAYAVLTLAGTYATGDPIDAVWLLSYLLLGAAALHPSMAGVVDPVPPAEPHLSRGRLLLLATASLMAPAVLGVQAARGGEVNVPVIVAGSAALFLLVLVRLAGLTGQVETKVQQLSAKRSELEHTLRELESAQAERTWLLGKTIRVGEDERMRVAAELHDGPIQSLSAVGLELERARLHILRGDTDRGRRIVGSAQIELGESIDRLRRQMTALRPPILDQGGIEAALRDHVLAFFRKTGVAGRVEAHGGTRADPEIETVVYRVAQEALRNVARHARARRVNVRLDSGGGEMRLRITDDGAGFDASEQDAFLRRGHFGLASMRERVQLVGGTWEISSRPGRGTSILRATPRLDLPRLLPLDRAWRLGRHVVDHPVHPRDLGDDPARHPLQRAVRQAGPVRRHGVLAGHSPDHDRVVICPAVAHHPHGPDGDEHSEALPQARGQPRPASFLVHDAIGRPDDLEPLGGDLAHDAYGQAGAGKGLSPHDLLRQTQLLTHLPNLVLEQFAKRLHQLQVHPLWKPPDVVVALDPSSRPRPRLDDVRVKRPLDQEPDIPEPPGHLLENADELLADGQPLLLRIGDPGEPGEEAISGLDVHQRDLEVAGERVLHLLGLALPEEPSVHEDAGQAVSDGPVDEEGGNRGVDTARQGGEYAPGAGPLTDARHLALDHIVRSPLREQAARFVEEPLHHVHSPWRVGDLGVELNGEKAALSILHGGHRNSLSPGRDPETRWRSHDGVGVAHPHCLLGSQVDQEHAGVLDGETGPAVLPSARRAHLTPQGPGHQLLPVTDPEHRDPEPEHPGVDVRRARLVHRGWASGEDDPGRAAGQQIENGRVVGNDLRVDVTLADPARDELRILGPEVDNQNWSGAGLLGLAHDMPTPCARW
jgi:signal transduction histidine kinase